MHAKICTIRNILHGCYFLKADDKAFSSKTKVGTVLAYRNSVGKTAGKD